MAKVVRNVSSILAKVDIDGLADGLILDADGDTTISSPTDDQIDVEVGGADVAVIRKSAPAILRTEHATVTNLTSVTEATACCVTFSAANMLDGLILRDPNGCCRCDTTDTAANIVGAILCATVDDVFSVILVNTANDNEAITLNAGCGVTLVPATVAIAQNESATLLVHLTNVCSSCEAVSIYSQVSAGT